MSASTATTRPVTKLIARLTATLAATTVAAAAAATLGMAPAPASAATTSNWVMTGWNIHQLNQLNPALATHFFNTPASYATGPAPATSPVSDGFTTSSVLIYTSYAQFAADLTSHAIAPSYTWVMYDPEYWSATPIAEQQNPAAYMQQFGQLAHANGLKVIEAPGRDLGLVPGAACPETPGENLDHWFLRCNIPAAAAASGDMVVIQDQVNTTNPAEFDYLYTSSRAEAQAANPQITTDPEVSTSYGTATQMATAAKSAHADGIYINATSNTLHKATPSSTSCRPPATDPGPAGLVPRSAAAGHQAFLRPRQAPGCRRCPTTPCCPGRRGGVSRGAPSRTPGCAR